MFSSQALSAGARHGARPRQGCTVSRQVFTPLPCAVNSDIDGAFKLYDFKNLCLILTARSFHPLVFMELLCSLVRTFPEGLGAKVEEEACCAPRAGEAVVLPFSGQEARGGTGTLPWEGRW